MEFLPGHSRHVDSVGRKIAAVAELSEERSAHVRDEYGIPAGYSDFRTMLKEVRPDAVYVILPHLQTYPVALECIKMGLNVFLEKPPGITLEQTRYLARQAEARRCITMVGFQRRYAPLVVQAAQKAEARGGIDLLTCRFYKNGIATPFSERARNDREARNGKSGIDKLVIFKL